MPSSTVFEYVMAELIRDDGKTYHPKLKLMVREIFADGKTEPIAREIARNELTPMSNMVIEDGDYTLRFVFDGQQQGHRVRIDGGTMLAA
jgi:hypothetical protein